jgi:hypothetical protein
MENKEIDITGLMLVWEQSNESIKTDYFDRIKYVMFKLDKLISDVEDLKIDILLKKPQKELTQEQSDELHDYLEVMQAIEDAKPLILLQLVNKIDLNM